MVPETRTPQAEADTSTGASTGRTRCTHERVCVRACVPVSAGDHGQPSTYGQKLQSMCTGTARDHDLLHRVDDAGDREAEVGLAQACNVAILVGVVFVVVEFSCEAKIVRVQVYPLDAQCWHASEKASAGTFVTGNRFVEFNACSLASCRS